MEVGDAEALEVADLVDHPAQVAGEAVDVRRVADGLRSLEPVRGQGAAQVEGVQLVVTLREGARGEGDDPLAHRGRVGVHRQAVEEVRPPALDPGLEELAAVGRERREDVLQVRGRGGHGDIQPHHGRSWVRPGGADRAARGHVTQRR